VPRSERQREFQKGLGSLNSNSLEALRSREFRQILPNYFTFLSPVVVASPFIALQSIAERARGSTVHEEDRSEFSLL